MKQLTMLTLLFVMGLSSLNAQKYFTREGKISFYSDTPIEKIEAHNQKATCVLNTEDGRMEFAVLIKAFQFEKALMQEHFNENYMESGTYPKSVFKGQIINIDEVNFEEDGTYDVQVEGELTIRGISKAIATTGKLTVKEGQISAEANFEARPADYNIKIPSVVRNNIAEIVEVQVEVALDPFNR